MRRFTVYRAGLPGAYLEQGHANPPGAPQFEGVVFSDGTVCVRWMTAYPSHSTWASLQDLLAVHGHPEYGTRIEWHDGTPGGEPCCQGCSEAGRPGEERPRTFGPFIPMDMASAAAALDELAGERSRDGRWR